MRHDEIGGKGANLMRLVRGGNAVPPFLIVTTAVFDAATRKQWPCIQRALWGIDFADSTSIEAAAEAIGSTVRACDLPPGVGEDLHALVKRDLPGISSFAVRSSVVGEDSQENSFAGQMDSFLNVKVADLTRAIKNVWRSAFSQRALLYRHRRGLPLDRITTAVIVQEMLSARSSGVLFTRDPETHARLCVIAAGYGLGEGVVQDLVDTDTYRAAWDGSQIERAVGTKSFRVNLNGPRGGTRIEAVPDSDRRLPVLDDRQVRRLVQTAIRLEKRFGAPQDIEWAFDREGRLFILQTRPIVFANRQRPDIRIWDNANIIESYPGLTSPLTFSFVRQCYETSFRRAALGFLVDRRDLRDDLHIFKNMIGLLNGRVYYNLLNWYTMLAYLPGHGRHRQAWDRMIGIAEKVPFPARRASWPNRISAALSAVYRLLRVNGTARQFFRRFDRTYARYGPTDFAAAAEVDLLASYRSMQAEFSRFWHLTLYNDFAAMKYYDWLRQLCAAWFPADQGHLYNDLLCAEAGVESTRPVFSLLAICEQIDGGPRFQDLFARADDAEVWRRIQTEPACASLKVAFQQHLEAYGDRGTEELKLETPTFRERPELLVRLVRGYRDRGVTAAEMQHAETELRARAEQAVRDRLRDPFRRALFRFVLRNARRAVAQRENMRFARTRLFGIVRRLFGRWADLAVERGVLACRDDFYFLTLGEVFDYSQGASVTRDLRSLVRLRREEYDRFAADHPAERFTTDGIPYLQTGEEHESGPRKATLRGTGCSAGAARGLAWVVSDPATARRPGRHVLVARSTDPGWVFLMTQSHGIIVERGSVLSHTAIIGRELGIPTVVGVRGATRRIRDGHPVYMDGRTGEVRCE